MPRPEDLIPDELEHPDQTWHLQQSYPPSQEDQRSLLRIRTRLLAQQSAAFSAAAPLEELQTEPLRAVFKEPQEQLPVGQFLAPREARPSKPQRRAVSAWRLVALVAALCLLVLGGTLYTLARVLPSTAHPSTPQVTPTKPELTPVSALPSLANGSSAYLVDATAGRVLLNVQGHLRVPMWSTTKIMTALLAIENLPLDRVVTVTQDELNEVPAGMSVAQLHPTDQLSILHLLYGLLLPSGSDAAVVLAHAVSGNAASFVALMNTRAAQLGLTDTHYANPYGGNSPGNYSSAADLVKLARVAMGNSIFAQIVATPGYHIPANLAYHRYDWDNILTPFLQGYAGANGIQIGSNAAGSNWCMVFSAYRHGHLLIGAAMQVLTEHQAFLDARNILDKGFSS